MPLRHWARRFCFAASAADEEQGAPRGQDRTSTQQPTPAAQQPATCSPAQPQAKPSVACASGADSGNHEAIVKAAHAAAVDVVAHFARAAAAGGGGPLPLHAFVPASSRSRLDQDDPAAVVFQSDLDPFADDAVSPHHHRARRHPHRGLFPADTFDVPHGAVLAVPPLRTHTGTTLPADDTLQQPGAPRWRPSSQSAFDPLGSLDTPAQVMPMLQARRVLPSTGRRSVSVYDGSVGSGVSSPVPASAPRFMLPSPHPSTASRAAPARLRHVASQDDVLSSFLSVLPPVHAPNPQRFKRTVTEPPMRLESPPSSGAPVNPFFGPAAVGGHDNYAHIASAGGLVYNSAPVSICRQVSAGSRLQATSSNLGSGASPIWTTTTPAIGGWVMPGMSMPPRRVPTPPIPVPPPPRPSMHATPLTLRVPMVTPMPPAVRVAPVVPLPHLISLAAPPVAVPPVSLPTPFSNTAYQPEDITSPAMLPGGTAASLLHAAPSCAAVSCTARSSMSLATWVGPSPVRLRGAPAMAPPTPRSPAPPMVGTTTAAAAAGQEPEDLLNLFMSWGSAELADEGSEPPAVLPACA